MSYQSQEQHGDKTFDMFENPLNTDKRICV